MGRAPGWIEGCKFVFQGGTFDVCDGTLFVCLLPQFHLVKVRPEDFFSIMAISTCPPGDPFREGHPAKHWATGCSCAGSVLRAAPSTARVAFPGARLPGGSCYPGW